MSLTKKQRIIALACGAALLLAGLGFAAGWFWGHRDSSTAAKPGYVKGTYISTSPKQLKLPGIWLGPVYNGTFPVISMIRVRSAQLNGIYYSSVSGKLALGASVESFRGPLPADWKPRKTPMGTAYVDPLGYRAYIKDQNGNRLLISALAQPLPAILDALQKRPE